MGLVREHISDMSQEFLGVGGRFQDSTAATPHASCLPRCTSQHRAHPTQHIFTFLPCHHTLTRQEPHVPLHSLLTSYHLPTAVLPLHTHRRHFSATNHSPHLVAHTCAGQTCLS